MYSPYSSPTIIYVPASLQPSCPHSITFRFCIVFFSFDSPLRLVFRSAPQAARMVKLHTAMIRHCIISTAQSGSPHKVATFGLSVFAFRERIWPKLLSPVGTWRHLLGSNTLYLTYHEIDSTARMQRGNYRCGHGAQFLRGISVNIIPRGEMRSL